MFCIEEGGGLAQVMSALLGRWGDPQSRPKLVKRAIRLGHVKNARENFSCHICMPPKGILIRDKDDKTMRMRKSGMAERGRS